MRLKWIALKYQIQQLLKTCTGCNNIMLHAMICHVNVLLRVYVA